MKKPLLGLALPLALALFPAACADDYGLPRPAGVTPIAPGADPAGQEPAPDPTDCTEAYRRCAHEFTYPAGGEATVELRGSFAPGGWETGVALTRTDDVWTATVEVPWDTDVQYKFVVDGEWVTDPKNPDTADDGYGGVNSLLSGVTCEEWTCSGNIGTFDWRDAVLYFVFVDRFKDGDPSNNGPALSGVEGPAQYKGGDWAGVRQKIEEGYFTDLGVNTLWLSVPMDNADVGGWGSDGRQYSAYHAYWPTDLSRPEPRFGTIEELRGLVEAAHAKGIKVILDYAMNHVHKDSPVYAEHPDWFWPLNDGSVSNCTCGGGCSWDGDQGRRCWFTDYLPDFNFTNQAARDFSVSNAIQWIKDTGIDGFRLDAVKHIEDSWLLDLRSRVRTEIEAESGEHFYMVGETFTGQKDTIKYYVNPDMLDGQFDFPLRAVMIRSLLMRAQDTPMSALDGFLSENESFYGSGIMSTFVGNHDIPRPIHYAEDSPMWGSEWDDGKNRAWSNQPGVPGNRAPFERLANAFTVLFTTKGVPLVYYGDEVGMAGAGDPDNRRPMQWEGYSEGQGFLREHLAKLGAIRAAHPALRRGSRSTLSAGADTLAYRMSGEGDEVIVAVNRSDAAQTVGGLPGGSLTDLLSGAAVLTDGGSSVSVPPRSAMILVVP